MVGILFMDKIGRRVSRTTSVLRRRYMSLLLLFCVVRYLCSCGFVPNRLLSCSGPPYISYLQVCPNELTDPQLYRKSSFNRTEITIHALKSIHRLSK
ncbi:hypothetical protein BC834DRAFT_905569 [Gloeopeniophorella convolvens]|nr:hypothetical protein BC834DRAFT_905569 [Gloeopeniophorella convolvens]